MKSSARFTPVRWRMVALVTVTVSLLLLLIGSVVLAQDATTTDETLPPEEKIRTQSISGSVERGKPASFVMEGLAAGDTIAGYASGTSGSLDPFLLLLNANTSFPDVGAAYDAAVQAALDEGGDPLAMIPQIADEYFLVWDDDSGAGYDATYEYEIPKDGDYSVIVISSPYADTFGDFALDITFAPAGIEIPKEIAIQDEAIGYVPEDTLSAAGSQEFTGTLTLADASGFSEITEIKEGDTLYAFIEATSGDLKPVLMLEDYGGKPLAIGNADGTSPSTTLQYTFPDDAGGYRLVVTSVVDDVRTEGDARYLIGINDPDVLTGQSDAPYKEILRKATRVKFGIIMDQITGVDQKSENFGVVADTRMEWQDPKLAFSPDECQCRFKTYTLSTFDQLVSSVGANWPEYTVFNQQGRRDSQSPTIILRPDGNVIYLERFSATLQAPDFNFRRFPFDTQDFYIRFRSILPSEFYIYEPLPGYSGLGDQLGEEEWIVEEADVFSDLNQSRSRFNFHFDASRHLSFYIFRIFIPILLIIIVSWITFFLADYSRRVEVTSGNLLVFIAFNFTISDELPRLGYLTFIDTVLISTFIVTALVIILNVYLKRLEVNGRDQRAERIDNFVIWFYPLAYIIGGLIVTIVFFTELGDKIL